MAANTKGMRPTTSPPEGYPNLLTGCPRCDWHGPDLPLWLTPTDGELRDWHRAWHDLARTVTPLSDRLAKFLAR